MTIYLYLKTHNVTGLKYLGKTIRKDPHAYRGSGKYWLNHIRKHGYDVTTTILLATKDENDIKETGIYFSNLWSIVESDDWANLKPECGDGGKLPGPFTDAHINAIRKGIKNRNITAEKNGMFGRNHSVDAKLKMSIVSKDRLKGVGSNNSQFGKRYTWINDGSTNKKCYGEIPEGFVKGRKPYTEDAMQNFVDTAALRRGRKYDPSSNTFI